VILFLLPQPVAANRALETKRRIELLPLPNPPPSSLSGCPTARATWGDVCSLARRIFRFEEAGACMKPALWLPMGFLICPLFDARPFDVLLVAWDFMVINNIFWAYRHNLRDFMAHQNQT